jgi:hypothetical protein
LKEEKVIVVNLVTRDGEIKITFLNMEELSDEQMRGAVLSIDYFISEFVLDGVINPEEMHGFLKNDRGFDVMVEAGGKVFG